MRRPELLAPAGDPEKLQSAIHFGADAVYLAGERFGMRKASRNFSEDRLAQAVLDAHAQGVRIYVTLNILPHEEDFVGLEAYVRQLEDWGVDAVIVSDPGVFSIVREHTGLPIHLSTQASVTNARTVQFWHELGAKRIVLARELSLEEIRVIREKIAPEVELEVFVHGAMCISYSGRCLLSNYLTGRDANQGDCAQACRWKYHLVEEKRPGEYLPIEEAEGGTYIMNSKDLCLLPDLAALQEAGVSSFKIEGRVKSQYYVATAVRSYRLALDAIAAGCYTPSLESALLEELGKASHRDYTKGFLYGKPVSDAQNYKTSGYQRSYEFVGVVLDYDAERGMARVEERNRVACGDVLEWFGRESDYQTIRVSELYAEDGASLAVVNRPRMTFWTPVPAPVQPGDLVRRALEGGHDGNQGRNETSVAGTAGAGASFEGGCSRYRM